MSINVGQVSFRPSVTVKYFLCQDTPCLSSVGGAWCPQKHSDPHSTPEKENPALEPENCVANIIFLWLVAGEGLRFKK